MISVIGAIMKYICDFSLVCKRFHIIHQKNTFELGKHLFFILLLWRECLLKLWY